MDIVALASHRYLRPILRGDLWLPPVVLALLLAPLASVDYLTFHTLAELVSIVIAFSIFAFGWYTHPFSHKNFLLILATGYLWIGVLDFLHTFVYKGMNLFVAGDPNLAISFWLSARGAEALLLLFAVWGFRREFDRGWLTASFGVITLLMTGLVLSGAFPTGYVEGEGLTPFKVFSEYVIILAFGAAALRVYWIRDELKPEAAALIGLSILFTMAAELFFTFYVSVYGPSNLLGHIFKLFSYWFIFRAVIDVSLQSVYRDLQASNEQLARSQAVQQRLALAVEQNPAPIIITDVAGVIEYVNSAFSKVTGYAREEALGRNPRILSSHEMSRSEYQTMWQQISSGKPWQGVFHNRRKDGSLYWGSATISPLLSPQGDILNYVGIQEDVSQRIKLVQETAEQKELLEVIIGAITDGIVFTDVARRIISINPAFTNIFGYSEDELRGKETAYFYQSQEDFEQQGRIRYNLSAEELLQPYTVTYRRRDGSLFPGETIGRKIADKSGKLVGFIGIIRDITERLKEEELVLRHEAELKRERDLAQRYLDVSPAMLAVLNGEGEIDLINQRGCELLGYSEEEILHRNWFDLFVPEAQRAEIKDVFSQIVRGEIAPVEYYENTLTTNSGEERLFSFHNATAEDGAGRIIGVLFAADDISDRVQTEHALRHAIKMEAVGQLTGGIAHDFNNILGVIMGNLELLQSIAGDNPKVQRRIDAALRGSERGAAITRKLLNFSRGQSENIAITDLNVTIEGLRELIARSLTPQIDIQTRLEANLWSVEIDPGELEDALLNLAINARDAMPQGGILMLETHNRILDEGYVRLHPEAQVGNFVQLTVSDTGQGIPKEVRDRVFEPFFSTKATGKGTGLGLSMVYAFAQRSRGHIQVYSEKGIGASFRLYLPRAGRPQQEGSGPEDDHKPPSLGGNETILVVDDEEMLLEMAVEILETLGYRTIAAKDSGEALVQLQRHPEVDLLFSDIIMPGNIDGYQLALTAIKNRPKLKVLLTSGYTGNREVYVNGDRGIVEALARRLLSKPYGRPQLAQAVRQALDEEPPV